MQQVVVISSHAFVKLRNVFTNFLETENKNGTWHVKYFKSLVSFYDSVSFRGLS